MSEAAASRGLISALEEIAQSAGEDGISLGEFVDALGERAFGIIADLDWSVGIGGINDDGHRIHGVGCPGFCGGQQQLVAANIRRSSRKGDRLRVAAGRGERQEVFRGLADDGRGGLPCNVRRKGRTHRR